MNPERRTRKPYRPRWPWDSYGPQWKELWLKASREAFYYDFSSSTLMNSTLLRAQHYRRLARERNEPFAELLYRATTHKDKIIENRLHFRPVEEPHRDFFEKIGIPIDDEAPEIDTSLPPPAKPEPSEPASGMDSFMEKLISDVKPEGEL